MSLSPVSENDARYFNPNFLIHVDIRVWLQRVHVVWNRATRIDALEFKVLYFNKDCVFELQGRRAAVKKNKDTGMP